MRKEIRIRCRIDLDGKKFFGPGPASLLELIGKEGSIKKAAKAMGMSYKKAWDIIDRLNEMGKKPYVSLQKGGEKGGGAVLTDAGKKLLNEYSRLTAKIDALVTKNTQILKLV